MLAMAKTEGGMGFGRRFLDGTISLLETLREGFRLDEEPRHPLTYRLEFGALRSISLERERAVEDDGDAEMLRDLLRDTAPRGTVLLDPDDDETLAILSPERGVLILTIVDGRFAPEVSGRMKRSEVEAIMRENGLDIPVRRADVRPRGKSGRRRLSSIDGRDLSSGDPWASVDRVWPLADRRATAEEITRAIVALWGVPESPASMPEWWEPGDNVDEGFARRSATLAIRRAEKATGTVIRPVHLDAYVTCVMLPAYARTARQEDETVSAWTALLAEITRRLTEEAGALAAGGKRRLVVNPDFTGKKLSVGIDTHAFAESVRTHGPR
jgi:hypothetical protein